VLAESIAPYSSVFIHGFIFIVLLCDSRGRQLNERLADSPQLTVVAGLNMQERAISHSRGEPVYGIEKNRQGSEAGEKDRIHQTPQLR
jgi:hypothetical protein